MLPLEERKLRLRKTIEGRNPQIQYTDHITGQAARFYGMACEHGAEGIVCKRLDAPYKSGDRRLWQSRIVRIDRGHAILRRRAGWASPFTATETWRPNYFPG